jgi:hypothetical protein
MEHFFSNLLMETNEKLNIIVEDTKNTFQLSEESLIVVLDALQNLKIHTIKYTFKDTMEEIQFFKHLKPQLFSKLIYYSKVLSIETKLPKGSDKTIKKYLCNELDSLHRFFDNYLDFYKYYRTGATYLDEKYFLRGKYDIHLSIDTFFFTSDPEFNTSHDYKVAKILANDLLEVYLKDKLATVERKEVTSHKTQVIPKIKLTWTANKTALIELIYGLHTQDAFDNGKADIKQIAEYFETIFNIDLGDYYRSYLEMRNRKANPTKFLDSMKENLLKRMEETEIR